MQKIITLVKKFLNNPKFSFLVAVLQGIALVVSFFAYYSFHEFWAITHALGEEPVGLSTFTWIISIAYYFCLGVLPHFIFGLLQLNYLIKYIRQTNKSVFVVLGWIMLISLLVVVLGWGVLLTGIIYIHDVYFRY